jgi:hypothetical protein
MASGLLRPALNASNRYPEISECERSGIGNEWHALRPSTGGLLPGSAVPAPPVPCLILGVDDAVDVQQQRGRASGQWRAVLLKSRSRMSLASSRGRSRQIRRPPRSTSWSWHPRWRHRERASRSFWCIPSPAGIPSIGVLVRPDRLPPVRRRCGKRSPCALWVSRGRGVKLQNLS